MRAKGQTGHIHIYTGMFIKYFLFEKNLLDIPDTKLTQCTIYYSIILILKNSVLGCSVGLLLPPDATPRQRQQFEQTLVSMTALLDQTTPSAPPLEQEPSAPPIESEQEDTHVSVKGLSDREQNIQSHLV